MEGEVSSSTVEASPENSPPDPAMARPLFDPATCAPTCKAPPAVNENWSSVVVTVGVAVAFAV